jgi:hypothetical protein
MGDECMTIADLPSTQHFALAEIDGRALALGSISVTNGGTGGAYGGGGRDVFPTPVGPMPGLRRELPRPRAVSVSLDTVSVSPAKLALGNERRRPGNCSLPRALAVDRAQKLAWVACMGDDRVLAYELMKIGGEWFAAGTRENVAIAGAPAALALDADGALVVWTLEARTLTRVARDKTGRAKAGPATNVPIVAVLDTTWKKGRALFHSSDTHVSSAGFACAHCHPDGRDDDVVWTTPRGARRPLSLLGLPAAGPYGWDAHSPTLERHIKETITIHLGGAGLADDEMSALVAYVRSMQRPEAAKDAPDGGGDGADGRRAFDKADCSKCHDPANGYGDSSVHQIAKDVNMRTPRLVGLGGRRAFFHDGRYASLDALLGDKAVSMGDTSSLSSDERRALVSFLERL